ncbi:MAG: hypothetical protein ACRCUY_06590 [Thermoguttaceae bacterium]
MASFRVNRLVMQNNIDSTAFQIPVKTNVMATIVPRKNVGNVFHHFCIFCSIISFFGMILLSETGVSQENARWSKVVNGFKERGYYDTALDYLNWLSERPNCPESLKNQIDYQRSLVHLDAIESGKMYLPREDHIKQCQNLLLSYVEKQPSGDNVFEAQTTLGRLFLEEGRIGMLKADHELTRDADRQGLRERARSDFEKALPFFQKADALASEQAKKLQEARKSDPNSVKDDALTAAYGRFLAGKIMVNLVKSDIAKTFPKDGDEFKKRMSEVAKAFSDLASKYKEFPAGFEAKLYAAKAYKELGDFKKVREFLGELNVLQGDSYNTLLSESLLLTLEMNLADQKPENFADSVRRVRAWNDNVPASSKRSREGQRIFLLGAKTFIAFANSVKDNKSEYDKAIRDAGVFLRQITPSSPAIAKEAQELLRSIGAIKTDRNNPQNYEEAKEFATEDWNNFVMAFTESQEAKGDAKKEAESRLGELGKTCIASINTAINMQNEDTPASDINALRMNLVRAYWFQKKLLEAALIADFLVQHNSSAPDAEQTAAMAVRLYRQVFIDEKLAGGDPDAVGKRLSRLCDFILTRWEGQPVTGEVRLLQIDTAIDSGDIEEAKKLVMQTAEGSPQRISAELKIGQSLWNQYSSLARLPEGAEDKPNTKDLDALFKEAKKQLEIGAKGKVALIKDGKATVDPATVQCAFVLAQMCLNDNQSQQAIDWLTDSIVGPLALIASPPSSVPVESLKAIQLGAVMTLLRAYVAAEKLDKAEETMNQLEKIIKEQTATETAGDSKDSEDQKLTRIYVALGRQLENRLKDLNEAGEIEQAGKVAQGFGKFLEKIKKRGDSNTFQSLYWVADTFYRLGSGMSSGEKVPEDAQSYYKNAAGTYVEILKRLDQESDWAPERAASTINTRLAESLRCIGMFEPAATYIESVLEDSPNRIDIQLEAAKTLEAWGKKDPQKLTRAVTGGFPSKNVWGWNGLIKRASADINKHSELYFDAYLGKFRSVIALVKTESDKEKKAKLLDNTSKDFVSLLVRQPQLGGPEWFAKFDQVYKDLERQLGKKPAGLKELLKTIGDISPQQKVEADGTSTEFNTDFSADTSASESNMASQTAKTSKTKKSSNQNTNQGQSIVPVIGFGVVVLLVPVIAFFLFRKKKR